MALPEGVVNLFTYNDGWESWGSSDSRGGDCYWSGYGGGGVDDWSYVTDFDFADDRLWDWDIDWDFLDVEFRVDLGDLGGDGLDGPGWGEDSLLGDCVEGSGDSSEVGFQDLK